MTETEWFDEKLGLQFPPTSPEKLINKNNKTNKNRKNKKTNYIHFLAHLTVFFIFLSIIYSFYYHHKHPNFISPDSFNRNSIGLTLDTWVQPQLNIIFIILWTIFCIICVITMFQSYLFGYYFYYTLSISIQWIIIIYQTIRIFLSILLYILSKCINSIYLLYIKLNLFIIGGFFDKHIKILTNLNKKLQNAKTYKEWKEIGITIDIMEGKDEWKHNNLFLHSSKKKNLNLFLYHLSMYDNNIQENNDVTEIFDSIQLHKNLNNLISALKENNIERLKYLLSSYMKRDKLGIDTPSLHLQCKDGSKHIINLYTETMVKSLETVCKNSLIDSSSIDILKENKQKTIRFFKKLKRSLGSTALCLSGGGSLAMYHTGVVLALIEADLLPNVISGSSGGSIVAAMLACRTNDELIKNVINENISTYGFKDGIRWFPPLLQQLGHFFKHGVLVSNDDFERTTKYYFGTYCTFQDAFNITGRHVSISVSASEITKRNRGGPQKLLLNHIHTPHVLIWSAVAVSCSLPGIMKSKKLMAKDVHGNILPYVSLGEEWMDGSMQQDLPMETMATTFNVTNFIVSQVNPHVVPFLGRYIDEPLAQESIFHLIETILSSDIRHRFGILAALGLFPRVCGHSFSQWFQQSFVGHVTIVPNFILSEAIGFKAILNPTKQDMRRYINGGKQSTWPKLSYIQHLCCIEKCINKCIDKLYLEKEIKQE